MVTVELWEMPREILMQEFRGKDDLGKVARFELRDSQKRLE